MIRRTISQIIVHHSAVVQKSLPKLLGSINRSHKARFNRKKGYVGTEYIQYHFVIGVDGKVKKIGSLENVLYHASNWEANQTSIAVCLSGNFDKHVPTPKQYGSLINLIEEYDVPVAFHNDFARKSCPGKLFNKKFVEFMSKGHYYLSRQIKSFKRQKITKHYEYLQTVNDCTRYGVLGGLSDIVGRIFTDDEVANFKRWSNMFSDLGEASNGIEQAELVLKRWNFNNPDDEIRGYMSTPIHKDKKAMKLLNTGYPMMYTRITGYDFLRDKIDGRIDNTMFSKVGGWHFTRAVYDRSRNMLKEINNYKGEKNNIFLYEDFITFARNGNTKRYSIFFYRPRK